MAREYVCVCVCTDVCARVHVHVSACADVCVPVNVCAGTCVHVSAGGGGSVVGVGVGVCALTRTRTHYSGARHKPAWGRIVWTGHVDMMTITVLLEVCEGTLWGMGRKPS